MIVLIREQDVIRTNGIDTDYIQTTDFELEKEDKDFLVQVIQAEAHYMWVQFCLMIYNVTYSNIATTFCICRDRCFKIK